MGGYKNSGVVGIRGKLNASSRSFFFLVLYSLQRSPNSIGVFTNNPHAHTTQGGLKALYPYDTLPPALKDVYREQFTAIAHR